MPRTVITTPRVVSRFMGGCTLFNGTSSYIEATAHSSLLGNTQKTFSAYIRITGTTDNQTIVSMGATNALGKIAKFAYNFSTKKLNITTYGTDFNSTALLIPGRWYHVVAVFGSSLIAYVNGVSAGTAVALNDPLNTDGTIVRIGRRANSTEYFTGSISEVQIFNSAITAAQAQELFITRNISGVIPVSNFALDDLPPTYIDSVAGNNGTGTATTYSMDTPIQQRVVVSDDKASANGSALSAVGTIDTVTSLAGTVIGMAKVKAYDGNTICSFYATDGITDSWRFNIESTTGYPFIWTTNTSGSGATNPKPSIPVPKNEWFHFAIVQTISGGVITGKIYINGKLYGKGTRTSDVRACSRFAINDNPSVKTTLVVVFERELTPTEIRNHCFGRIIDGIPIGHVIPPSAKINWPRQEGAGNINYDASGNGANGTGGTLTWSADTPSKAREAVVGNLVKNGDFEYAPPFTAETTTSGRWIDGTSGGSLINNLFRFATYLEYGAKVKFDTSDIERQTVLTVESTASAPTANHQIGVSNTLNAAPTSFTVNNWYILNSSSQYTFSFLMKTVGVSSVNSRGAIASIVGYKGDFSSNVTIASLAGYISGTTGWTRYTITFTPGEYRFVKWSIRIVGETGLFSIDDIYLNKTIPDTRTAV